MRIEIKTDNAAFEEPGATVELARILRKLADTIEHQALGDLEDNAMSMPLFDANGNRVGRADF